MKEVFFAIKIGKEFFAGNYKKFVPSIQMAKWYIDEQDLLDDAKKIDKGFTVVEIYCQESIVLTKKNHIPESKKELLDITLL